MAFARTAFSGFHYGSGAGPYDAASRRAANVVLKGNCPGGTGGRRQQTLDLRIVDGANLGRVIKVRHRSFMMAQLETLAIERPTLDDRAAVVNRYGM